MILNFISQTRVAASVVIASVVVLGACAGQSDDQAVPNVVATTSILGDVVRSLTGDLAAVEVIIGDGVDPHDFAPSARQVESIAGADLVVGVGLGLEGAVLDTIDASARRSLLVGPLVDPIPLSSADRDVDTALDPHVW